MVNLNVIALANSIIHLAKMHLRQTKLKMHSNVSLSILFGR
jgi:hypothetical protein